MHLTMYKNMTEALHLCLKAGNVEENSRKSSSCATGKCFVSACGAF